MLLEVVETNNKLLTFLMSRNFFSKNFQVTKFCKRTHDDSKLENISYKW